MTLNDARKILGIDIATDGTLWADDEYICWDGGPEAPVVLDGRFSLERLEAIVVYCRYAISTKDVS